MSVSPFAIRGTSITNNVYPAVEKRVRYLEIHGQYACLGGIIIFVRDADAGGDM
jgi:hypothetical protein